MREPTEPSEPSDGGSGTVLVLGLCAVVLMATLICCALASAVVARHRADAAADLAALAAADRLLGRTAGDPCRAARVVATAQGARLLDCSPGPDRSVTIEVAVPLSSIWRGLGPARSSARAGPPSGQVTRSSPGVYRRSGPGSSAVR